MGRKKSLEKPRDDVSVKVDRTLIDKAKLIASRRGKTLAEFVTELIRPAIEREFPKVIKEMEGDSR